MAAAAPATAGADQLLQMCFGPGDRELNLSAVMSRVGDLRRSLDTVAADMAEGRGAHWAAFLDRLAVINVQHMQVVAQLRPLLRQYAAFPKFIDSAQVEGEVPSLLASRLLPEQEAEEGEARARLLGPSQQPELVLAAAEQQLEGLRAAVGALFGGGGGLGELGVLDPKARRRPSPRFARSAFGARVFPPRRAAVALGCLAGRPEKAGAPATARGGNRKAPRPAPRPDKRNRARRARSARRWRGCTPKYSGG